MLTRHSSTRSAGRAAIAAVADSLARTRQRLAAIDPARGPRPSLYVLGGYTIERRPEAPEAQRWHVHRHGGFALAASSEVTAITALFGLDGVTTEGDDLTLADLRVATAADLQPRAR